MCRILLATLAICLIAAPASAGKFVAVPEINTGIEPASKATADCRIENDWTNPCGTVFWSFGGWCIDDEVTTYYSLQTNACLAGCTAFGGQVRIESAEVGLRVVGTACNGGYPFTTYPCDFQYYIYTLDPGLSTPDCPFPNIDPICWSTVATAPALTATASTDPARSYNLLIPFSLGTPDQCCLDLQPIFGGVRWINFSVIESTLAACGQGGLSECAWWYPGLRGRNGNNPTTLGPCAVPCTQWYRNVSLYGPDWYDGSVSGLADLTDFAHWLNVSCYLCPVAVEKTTWGKLKSLMNN